MVAGIITTDKAAITQCAHCGAAGAAIVIQQKHFCCEGCSRVYAILKEQNLLGYYDFPANNLESLKDRPAADFGYCDGDWFRRTFTTPAGNGAYSIRLRLPAIHCAACVWLLEKLPEMLPGVTAARINYLAKEIQLTATESLSTGKLIQFIAELGYTPDFSPESPRRRALSAYDKGLLKRMAVAAFGFGNAMLFSFPEYFSERLEGRFQLTFMVLNVALSSFVLIYSAGEFFSNAFRALRRRKIILDLPIAVGITAMFARSLIEIVRGVSSGYFDTFAGLIFFLLIGRYVQSRSYSWLNFERDNLLFLPLAVRVRKDGVEQISPVQGLVRGDTVRLLNGEIAPTRCRLLSADGAADYAFTTGESMPVQLKAGDYFEAGGRVVGHSLELEVIEEVDQARINRIWEEAGTQAVEFQKESSFADKVLPWFTGAVAATALGGLFYWLGSDSAKAWNAFSAVLVITCPCALAMAKPFSFFTTQSVLGRAGLFLKGAAVVEKFFSVKNIVFDKTGTLTNSGAYDTSFTPAAEPLQENHAAALKALANQSSHPLSRAIHAYLPQAEAAVDGFTEKPGHGLAGRVAGHDYLLGSAAWLSGQGIAVVAVADSGSNVFAAVDGRFLGRFLIQNRSRENLQQTVSKLTPAYNLALVSGDSERERGRFEQIFPAGSEIHFNASPEAKAEIIRQTSLRGKTMMIGDGLNDADALRAADLGIAISENQANFSPASDAILAARSFGLLPRLLKQARQAKTTAIAAYMISLGYNIFGVSVALKGDLTPLFCAVLMPLSSLSVISFTFLSARLGARFRGLV